MKLSIMFAIFATLSVTINGAWFVGIARPIILSFGAVFAALDLDLEPMLNIKLPFVNKLDDDQ